MSRRIDLHTHSTASDGTTPPDVLVRAAVVLGLYGAAYLGLGAALGFTEGDAWTGRLLRRRKR